MELTAEQQKFLDAIEEEFHDRFTESDAVYWEEHTTPLADPPIIEPWYNKPRRKFDFSRRGRGGDYNGRERSRHDNHRDQDRHRDRNRARDYERDHRRESRNDRGRYGSRTNHNEQHRRDDRCNQDYHRQRPRDGRSRSRDRDQW
ncbi:RNA guanine-N7 methyltransferase activating subunit [Frankliniella fusca]|uniref:RNA guanine-N7 methyltransferase activating subunit n=1 Tax=Frankliniella fusca TaxID=407009 RepID=A0AAE1HTS7_9NEOP|nr:RNA guanine-N7 methyltransferase activating subunit [Frankliniella fusca]